MAFTQGTVKEMDAGLRGTVEGMTEAGIYL